MSGEMRDIDAEKLGDKLAVLAIRRKLPLPNVGSHEERSAAAGGMAAIEAIKILAGFGSTLAGSLLTFDLRDMSSRRYTLRRCQDCPDCSPASGGIGV